MDLVHEGHMVATLQEDGGMEAASSSTSTITMVGDKDLSLLLVEAYGILQAL